MRPAKFTTIACSPGMAQMPSTHTWHLNRCGRLRKTDCSAKTTPPKTKLCMPTKKPWARACSRSWQKWASQHCNPTKVHRFLKQLDWLMTLSIVVLSEPPAAYKVSILIRLFRKPSVVTTWASRSSTPAVFRSWPTQVISTGAAVAKATCGTRARFLTCRWQRAITVLMRIKFLPSTPMSKPLAPAPCVVCWISVLINNRPLCWTTSSPRKTSSSVLPPAQ